MKTFLLASFTFLLSISLSAQWEYVGGNDVFFSGSSATTIQKLQFHPETNEPYVFFQDWSLTHVGPSLVKYNGEEWEYIDQHFALAGLGNTNSADFHWGFYFRQDNNLPVVFYNDTHWEGSSAKYDYHVAQRVGNTWEEIMGADNNTVSDVYFGAHRMTMVRNPRTNLPVIVGNGPKKIIVGSKTIVSQFDANSWGHIGDQAFGEFGAYAADIDYNLNTNIPYVITSGPRNIENGDPFVTEVWYFQGSWQSLGDLGFLPVNFGEGFRIRVNQLTGDVYVLSPERYYNPNNSQTMTLSIRKWDGITWETLGTPEEIWLSSTLGYDMEMHPLTGEPYICFVDGKTKWHDINIRKWNGNNWVSITSGNTLRVAGMKIDMVFQPETNIPYVVSTSGHLLKCVPIATTIDDYDVHKQVTLFPNPASSTVNITGLVIKEVSVFDIDGRRVLHTNKEGFSVKSLSSGVYIVQVTNSNNRKITSKLMVRK